MQCKLYHIVWVIRQIDSSNLRNSLRKQSCPATAADKTNYKTAKAGNELKVHVHMSPWATYACSHSSSFHRY